VKEVSVSVLTALKLTQLPKPRPVADWLVHTQAAIHNLAVLPVREVSVSVQTELKVTPSLKLPQAEERTALTRPALHSRAAYPAKGITVRAVKRAVVEQKISLQLFFHQAGEQLVHRQA
jgi:hypothetical protein